MRKQWLEVIKLKMEESPETPGVFHNKKTVIEDPFTIDHTVRVILGAGEFAPFSEGPHQHINFYRGSPSGDILLDTNHEHFLIIRGRSTESDEAQKRVRVHLHEHYIPWEKIIDLEFVETKSTGG